MPNLRRIQIQIAQRPAQSVPVHPKLFRSLALVALVVSQYLSKVPPLELLHSVVISHSGAVHLYYQAIQFALQVSLTLQPRFDRD
jgi:hypothetical protein